MADIVKLDRLELNDTTAKQILKNAPNADLRRRGEQVAAAAAAMSPAGARFFVDVQIWPARVAIYVTAGNEAARRGAAAGALLRALDAGR
jgi:hypothetical protein